ncbi:MAG TPA: ATP-binding protein [Crenalkalicoccus sp.]|nr:ATP-binding protein [Crenalkalicoccus sp.]
MTRIWCLQDTIARRFALTIIIAVVGTLGLREAAMEVADAWVRPSFRESGLVGRANDIVRMMELIPTEERRNLARLASNESLRVDWHAIDSAMASRLGAAAGLPGCEEFRLLGDHGRRRRVVCSASEQQSALLAGHLPSGTDHRAVDFLSVEEADGAWVAFTASDVMWSISPETRRGFAIARIAVGVLALSTLAAYQLARPIHKFTEGVRRFGNDPRASAMVETGPRELRDTIRAFNAMQAKIQAFVNDRTAMLAAISHDLRTPLTKMRLRGELIEDDEQRRRLFGDVDAMQAMVDSALAFFRDDLQDEETTALDLAELLRTIADDFADRGHSVGYEGADHLVHHGRPVALQRAFTNLIDNAVKYGLKPKIELRRTPGHVEVAVKDSGPGIPSDMAEQVFTPFFRLERSRNRATGGVGLGLTSARAVIQGHGGTISLQNRTTGGLEVTVSLPAV